MYRNTLNKNHLLLNLVNEYFHSRSKIEEKNSDSTLLSIFFNSPWLQVNIAYRVENVTSNLNLRAYIKTLFKNFKKFYELIYYFIFIVFCYFEKNKIVFDTEWA